MKCAKWLIHRKKNLTFLTIAAVFCYVLCAQDIWKTVFGNPCDVEDFNSKITEWNLNDEVLLPRKAVMRLFSYKPNGHLVCRVSTTVTSIEQPLVYKPRE